jgi:hypothetical protein
MKRAILFLFWRVSYSQKRIYIKIMILREVAVIIYIDFNSNRVMSETENCYADTQSNTKGYAENRTEI